MTREPFAILGIEPAFDLPPGRVEKAYLSRVAQIHPDLARDEDAASRAAILNEARATLLDPERRAGALLQKLGGPSPEADRSLPASFLAEMLEVREETEAAVATGDQPRIEHWRTWAADRRRAVIAEVSSLFASAGSPPVESSLREIRRMLNAWRYVERMLEQLHKD
jgi:curved DNA-binding protein CbpA